MIFGYVLIARSTRRLQVLSWPPRWCIFSETMPYSRMNKETVHFHHKHCRKGGIEKIPAQRGWCWWLRFGGCVMFVWRLPRTLLGQLRRTPEIFFKATQTCFMSHCLEVCAGVRRKLLDLETSMHSTHSCAGAYWILPQHCLQLVSVRVQLRLYEVLKPRSCNDGSSECQTGVKHVSNEADTAPGLSVGKLLMQCVLIVCV